MFDYVSDIEKYERALEKQNIENKIIPDKKEFEKKTFQQERDFFLAKVQETEQEYIMLEKSLEGQIAAGKITEAQAETQKKGVNFRKRFFEEKLRRVEHDLWILNKNKYDVIKYVPFM